MWFDDFDGKWVVVWVFVVVYGVVFVFLYEVFMMVVEKYLVVGLVFDGVYFILCGFVLIVDVWCVVMFISDS